MSGAARALLAIALALVPCGCPDPPPPPAPPPTRQPPVAPVATSAPIDSTPIAPGASSAPVRVTVVPPPPPGIGDRVRLGSGHLLSATPALRVGGRGVRDGRAQLEVLIGPFSYLVEAEPGETIAVGPATLGVDALEPEGPDSAGAALVRWEREAPLDAALELAPREREGRLVLREQALFALGDGTRVGVGDIRAGLDGPRVTLTVFPPGYQTDPGLGHARALRARAGAVVGGLRLILVRPREGEQRWGQVELTRE